MEQNKLRIVKILNENENHHGYQYKVGVVNKLNRPFDNISNPDDGAEGGFYSTTEDHIMDFLGFGDHIRVVSFPTGTKVKYGKTKIRSNKLQLHEPKYPLYCKATCDEFKLDYWKILNYAESKGLYTHFLAFWNELYSENMPTEHIMLGVKIAISAENIQLLERCINHSQAIKEHVFAEILKSEKLYLLLKLEPSLLTQFDCTTKVNYTKFTSLTIAELDHLIKLLGMVFVEQLFTSMINSTNGLKSALFPIILSKLNPAKVCELLGQISREYRVDSFEYIKETVEKNMEVWIQECNLTNDMENKTACVDKIKEFLRWCEITRGVNNKSFICERLFYFMSQTNAILGFGPKFLTTVKNKYKEFEHIPGTQTWIHKYRYIIEQEEKVQYPQNTSYIYAKLSNYVNLYQFLLEHKIIETKDSDELDDYFKVLILESVHRPDFRATQTYIDPVTADHKSWEIINGNLYMSLISCDLPRIYGKYLDTPGARDISTLKGCFKLLIKPVNATNLDISTLPIFSNGLTFSGEEYDEIIVQ